MPTVTTSQRFTLNLTDVWKGLIMAVILPILTTIQQSLENGVFTLNWKLIGLTALGSFIAYIIKNFFTPAEIVITNPPKETVKAVKEGDAEVVVQDK